MEFNKPNNFILYSGVYISRGFLRSVIIDYNSSRYTFIPTVLVDILDQLAESTLLEVKTKHTRSDQLGIAKYLTLLEDQNYGFFTSKSSYSYRYDNYSYFSNTKISNAVIDISSNTELRNIGLIFENLLEIDCQSIQVRLFSCKFLLPVLNNISKFSFVEILVPYSNELLQKMPLIKIPLSISFVVYGVKDCYKMNVPMLKKKGCTIIDDKVGLYPFQSLNRFRLSKKLHLESKSFNTYFNEKISFDTLGNIKNDSGMVQNFGNISVDKVVDTISKEGFKELWEITKSMLLVCRDCEFQNMCVDSRVPKILSINSVWGFDIECNFNPYVTKWNTEEGYQTVAQSIADGVVSEEYVYRSTGR